MSSYSLKWASSIAFLERIYSTSILFANILIYLKNVDKTMNGKKYVKSNQAYTLRDKSAHKSRFLYKIQNTYPNVNRIQEIPKYPPDDNVPKRIPLP